MMAPEGEAGRGEVLDALRGGVRSKLGDLWWTFMVRGVLAGVLGLAMLIWPSASFAMLMVLVGLYCLADGMAGLVAVLRGGERDAHLVQALLGIVAGAVLLFWPGGSIRALLIVFGVWLLLTGVTQIRTVRRLGVESDERSTATTIGALAAVVGLILILWPGTGMIAIGWVIAIAALAVAVLLIFLALRLRRIKERMDAGAATGRG